uniref:S8 family peptidase n=1 Tax=Indiicoccus explosivorum TaxID=1917864 RepID=UPI000B441979
MKKMVSGFTAAALLVSPFGGSFAGAESHDEKRVIVVFEETADSREMGDAVKEAGGVVTESFEQVPVATAEVPAGGIDELLDDPAVQSVEEDILISLNTQSVDWGIPNTNTPKAWTSGWTGEGVKVAVVDSGIAAHTDLRIAGGVSTVDYTASYSDDQGHGTHVAGIIAAADNSYGVVGVAHEASIYAVKAFNAEGQAYLSDLVEGIDWAITNDMDIINLSAGTRSDSTAFRSVIDKAYANGILVVAASGNNGTSDTSVDTVNYPARYDSAIGVAAVDKYGRRASFSSAGPDVEVAAPGVRIMSTYTGGQYAYMDGTSMATPYVTGVLALMKQAYPNLSNKELRALLTEQAKDLGVAGRDVSFGYGLVQASEFEPMAEPAAMMGLKLNASSITGVPGTERALTVTAAYDDGTSRDVTAEAAWTSDNAAVAEVAGGKVTLKGYGTTIVRVSFDGQSAAIAVDVPEPVTLTDLDLSASSVSGEIGESVQVAATADYSDGS